MDNVLINHNDISSANGDAPFVETNDPFSPKYHQKLNVLMPISNGIYALLRLIVGGMDYKRKLTV